MRVCALAGLDMELCELGKESGEMEAHSRDSQLQSVKENAVHLKA